VLQRISHFETCKLPFMCRTTIPCYLAYHKSLFLWTHYNLFPSAPTLQANKVIHVEVYCEQIATAKSTNSL